MSIEKITEKIIAEAKEQEQQLLSDAQQEEAEMLKKAEAEAMKIKEKWEEKSRRDGEDCMRRQLISAGLDGRKMVLSKKQEIIWECIYTAMDELSQLPQEEYISLLFKILGDGAVSGGELILNAKDRASIGESLVERINKETKGRAVTLSQETFDSSRGGFILRQGAVSINATFDVMMDTYDYEIHKEASEALFGSRGDSVE